jgi:hypothetical protein
MRSPRSRLLARNNFRLARHTPAIGSRVQVKPPIRQARVAKTTQERIASKLTSIVTRVTVSM